MKSRIYGQWVGNTEGVLEDKTRCIEEVSGGGKLCGFESGGWVSHQCQRKRGHGKNGLYCKQHSKKKGLRK